MKEGQEKTPTPGGAEAHAQLRDQLGMIVQNGRRTTAAPVLHLSTAPLVAAA